MDVSLLPAAKVTVVRLLVFVNAELPMVVTPAGMVKAVSALAPANALMPMDLSLLPAARVTVARLLAPMNAFAPMDVTPAGIVMAVSALAPANAVAPMDVSLLPAAKVTVARLLALLNAKLPMDVTPAGMVIAVSALAFENALAPIDVTPAGIRAMPVHALWRRTELSVIVIVPLTEHATIFVAACATVPCNSNTIIQIRRKVSIR
jgi:hypothetical protein